MLLTVKDRLIILELLPQETNFATLKIVRDLESELGFSEQEIKDYEMVADNDTIKWKVGKDTGKEITIGERAKTIIETALRKLDEENKLTKNHLSTCDKFLG